MAPSSIAPAISCIFGVPASAAITPRRRAKPTISASTAVPAEKYSQNHSVPPSSNAWYPPSEASNRCVMPFPFSSSTW